MAAKIDNFPLLSRLENLQGFARSTFLSLYNDSFSLESRELMAEFIEANIYGDGNFQKQGCYGGNFAALIKMFLETFRAKVESKELPVKDRERMWNIYTGLVHTHQRYPMAIFRLLCFNTFVEKHLVEGASQNGLDVDTNDSIYVHPAWINVRDMVNQFSQLIQDTTDCGNLIKEIIDGVNIAFNYQGKLKEILAWQSSWGERASLPLGFGEARLKCETAFHQQIRELIYKRQLFQQYITINIANLINLQGRVLEKLHHWQRQQYGADKGSFNEGLDTLQLWCETLADLNLNCKEHLNTSRLVEDNYQALGIPPMAYESPIPPTGYDNPFPVLSQKLKEALDQLVKRSFILEIQPPQVVRTGKAGKFYAQPRFLLGGTNIKPMMKSIIVKATFITEVMANRIIENKAETDAERQQREDYSTYEQTIENGTAGMEIDEGNKLVAKFKFYVPRNMWIEKIQRHGGVKEEKVEVVTRQKYHIKFEATFIVNGDKYEIYTLSLPIVVVVHGSQEMRAWGTIVYDDAVRNQKISSLLELLEVCEKPGWDSLAVSLNRFCAIETGRPLTPKNLQFLRDKFFKAFPRDGNDAGLPKVDWVHFSKDPIPILVGDNMERPGFSFWEWFYATIKLIKEVLVDTWRGDLIEGFISKQRATDLLLQSRHNGTFFLRFTESLDKVTQTSLVTWKGSITIMYVSQNGEGRKIVRSHQPFISTDLARRPLPNRVLEFEQALFLWREDRDTPKKSVFKEVKVGSPRPGYDDGSRKSARVVEGASPVFQQHQVHQVDNSLVQQHGPAVLPSRTDCESYSNSDEITMDCDGQMCWYRQPTPRNPEDCFMGCSEDNNCLTLD